MAENSLMEKRTRSPIIGILTHKEREEGGKIIIAGLCVVSMQGSRELIDTDRIRIDIPVKENAAQIRFGSRYGRKLPRGGSINEYEISIDREEARYFDIQNKLIVNYDGLEGRILYSAYDLKKGHNRNSKVFVRDGIAMYFRLSRSGMPTGMTILKSRIG